MEFQGSGLVTFDVEEKLKQLSVAEKVDLLSGSDLWHTKSLPAHSIPALRLSDGPNGVRGSKLFDGKIRAACFPCGTALGSTFNTHLLEETGRKMGEEARLKGVHCILGPTVNIQRTPIGGRGFESYSEDPVLSGLAAGALIRGIQSTGVQAALKHFVCNDQEHKRNAVQVMVTQRALREIYALPFQLAIRECPPGAIMAAYNGVNGKSCSENSLLLQEMLRDEWGWDGLVMSDWFGTYGTTDAMLAGLDLEMPGPTRFRGEALKFNVTTDKVREHVLDERVRAMLKFIKKGIESGIGEREEEKADDSDETKELVKRVATESIVLLKNEGELLPLEKGKKTLIVGPNAKLATYHGGGSAALNAYYAVTPYEGITAKLLEPPSYTVGAYSHKLLPVLEKVLTAPCGRLSGMRMRVYNDPPNQLDRKCIDELVVSKTRLLFADYGSSELNGSLWYAEFVGSFVSDQDCEWEFGLVVCGTGKLYVNDELVIDNATTQVQGELFFGCATREEKGQVFLKKDQRYTIRIDFASTPARKLTGPAFPGGVLRVGGCKIIDADDEIQRACRLAKDADQVIICAGLNGDWETEGHDRETMDLPGRLVDLISAVSRANSKTVLVNQSGTPITMPWIEQVPAVVQAWYGGNECGNAIADILFGDANPSGKLSVTFPVRLQDNPAYLNSRCEGGRTLYGEDVYVGYRYYEHIDIPVLFPFGHGLSYTTFQLSSLSVVDEGEGSELDRSLQVDVDITNTGNIKGAEVIQVYISHENPRVSRPPKEFKGFSKVELAPKEISRIRISISKKYACAYWDEERARWCVEKGVYNVRASNSSDDRNGEVLTEQVTVDETFWWNGL